ncbi:MAG: ribonuclease III [Pseudobdellovibrionaceae bacterium]
MSASLEEIIGYAFKDPALLTLALKHSSLEEESYERLEFLGDRVLGLVIAETLLALFPDEPEGALAKRLNALVRRETLVMIAQDLTLSRFIQVSDTERTTGGHESENVQADCVESLIGAVYLDGGFTSAHAFVKRLYEGRIDQNSAVPQDPKTSLQEWAQGRGLPVPDYEVIQREGPDHAPVFTVEVRVQGQHPESGVGPSRRHAEKEAASKLLVRLREE